jgi:hypothetical protein
MEPTVVAVEQTGPFRLHLRFDDGAEGEIDMRAYLPFEGVFEPLKDPAYFSQVRVDEGTGTIVWPNGADLDPWVLHSQVTGMPNIFDHEEAAEPFPNDCAIDLREISRFFEISVSMCQGRDSSPHFHARYGDLNVVIRIRTFGVLDGGLLAEWSTTHRAELLESWNLARSNKPLKKVPPLE